jgi:hypothetical protein
MALKDDTPLPASISQSCAPGCSFVPSSLAQAGQIIQLVSLFQKTGFATIEGTPLSQYFYDSSGLLSFLNFYLLVRTGDFVRVRDLLKA